MILKKGGMYPPFFKIKNYKNSGYVKSEDKG